jgi:sulfur relay (sulfurtransferase) complex TusBCD TusD component (DsrE family)
MFLKADACSVSTMSDLVEMISDSDKVVTFD